MPKPSFSSIAKELNISVAIVSNVLRNTSTTTLASNSTKQRILSAIWEKGLRLSNNIGVIVPREVRMHEALFYPGFAGITERCARLGFSTTLFTSTANDEITGFLKQHSVCGVIFWNQASPLLLKTAQEEKIPFVFLNPQQNYSEADSISFNDYDLMSELLLYLYEKSYRNYIFLSGNGFSYIEEQKRGFSDFLKEKNVSGVLLENFAKHRKELQKLIENSSKETVFITFARYETIKILEYFAYCSKSCPDDAGLVASNLLAAFYVPKLTTIMNPYYESGSLAVDMIVEKWNNRKFYLKQHLILKGKVIKNQSTESGEMK
ncbi:MAG: LacI family transcriptional regulator [Victivallales bacterium]|nr:LacI family transcriptional regulator [Victivallales bacterium]